MRFGPRQAVCAHVCLRVTNLFCQAKCDQQHLAIFAPRITLVDTERAAKAALAAQPQRKLYTWNIRR